MSRRFLHVVLILLTCACLASAEPHEIRFRNGSDTTPIALVRICSVNPAEIESCEDLTSPCGPSANCAETVDLAPGEHSIALRAAPEGGEWSEESNRITVTIEAEAGPMAPEARAALECMASDFCRADFDSDGAVTASDFGVFLREFSR